MTGRGCLRRTEEGRLDSNTDANFSLFHLGSLSNNSASSIGLSTRTHPELRVRFARAKS